METAFVGQGFAVFLFFGFFSGRLCLIEIHS